MIHLKQVDKYYDQKLILNIEELKLENGIYWINGINGSGKTTLLKMLAGIIPFNGDITINDISLKKKPVEYRKLVSLNRRFAQYGWFYCCLFIPEVVTIILRTPAFLYYSEACFFIFSDTEYYCCSTVFSCTIILAQRTISRQ